MKTQLQSIKIELAACRKAWAKNPDAKLAWCCHHEILIEPLTEPVENRIEYILSDKPENERAARFRSFRPVRVKLPAEFDKAITEFDKSSAEYDKSWTEYDKSWTEYNKSRAELNKASAEFEKASAEHDKVHTEFEKACAEYDNASAEYYKVCVNHKSELELFLNQDWPNNTWNGNTVFI